MDFQLRRGRPCVLYLQDKMDEAILLAARNLQADLQRSLGIVAEFTTAPGGEAKPGDIVLSAEAVCLPTDEQGKVRAEGFVLEVRKGVLYIGGSDRRGFIYGIYELSEQIGVSAWHYFADVPVLPRDFFGLEEGYRLADYPGIPLRGIFINDEEELDRWVRGALGEATIGLKAYAKIFELILRLKGNYLWPAMHVNSFNLDPENGRLAQRMGLIIGTSHCDMLMRSNNREWLPWLAQKGYKDVSYDYSLPGRNREILKEYWRESVVQNRDNEVTYTLGMRGIHDSGLEAESFADLSGGALQEAKVKLLQQIIDDQQTILRETLGREAIKLFVPYKEVLELYDSGLEIPDDFITIWANDNYGYIRRYPNDRELLRSGGHGIYYHNSYWAPPGRSYLFLSSIPLAQTKYEMDKAYAQGIRRLWICNMGAIKPLEQELEFFLRLAWQGGKAVSEDRYATCDVRQYLRQWLERSFPGAGLADSGADLLLDFARVTNQRKIEQLHSDAFSQQAYGDEYAARIQVLRRLFKTGNTIYERLPAVQQAAFYELVLMKVQAAYYSNLMFYFADRSRLMGRRGLGAAADLYCEWAHEVEQQRRRLIYYYNKQLLGGKWDGILTPEDFPPPRTSMFPVCRPSLGQLTHRLHYSLWNEAAELVLEPGKTRFFELGFADGIKEHIRLQAPAGIVLSQTDFFLGAEERVFCSLAENVPDNGMIEGFVAGAERPSFSIPFRQASGPEASGGLMLLRPSKVEAVQEIAYLNRYETAAPLLSMMPGSALEYVFELALTCAPILELHRYPSLSANGQLRFAVSVDGHKLACLESVSNDEWRGSWEENTLTQLECLSVELPRLVQGVHRLRIEAMDPYLALYKAMLYIGSRKENQLADADGTALLPGVADMELIRKTVFATGPIWPLPELVASKTAPEDTLVVTDRAYVQQKQGKPIKRETVLNSPPCYRMHSSRLLIDCVAVHASEGDWDYCCSQSYGGQGLALYPQLSRADKTLTYRLETEAGTYTLWVLQRYEFPNRGLRVFWDAAMLPEAKHLGGGKMWRYEGEQVWRWVPLIPVLTCTAGPHELKLQVFREECIYLDRIYIGPADESCPPLDHAFQGQH